MSALAFLAAASLMSAFTGQASGPIPELVGEGVLSTAADETSLAVSPDGKTAYFGKRSPATYGGIALDVICVTLLQHGRWSPPEVAVFSGQYRDVGPSFSPDGSRLFFASNRPAPGKPGKDFDLWYVERTAGGWSEPRRLPAPVNTSAQEIGVSVTAAGVLYFASDRPGGKGEFDIYRAKPSASGYSEPENVGEGINTEGSEVYPAIDPAETVLVFAATGRPDEVIGIHREYAHGDLYVSRRDGSWSEARNAGTPINSGAKESAPAFSADGKSLYFVSERGFATHRLPARIDYRSLRQKLSSTLNGLGNLYRIDVRALTPGK